MTINRVCAAALLVALTTGLAACGGTDSPSPSPGGPSGPGSNEPPGVLAATITISSAGATPKNVTVQRGQRVAFVNNDNVERVMSSDPHPVHSDCASLNVGGVPPGQTRESSNLNDSRTCGYHDHNDPGNSGVQGTVIVQ